MRVVLIKHDPGSFYRAYCPHDGHTRVLLAFYTPSVTSKSAARVLSAFRIADQHFTSISFAFKVII
jgi:hypothetical protein